MSQIFEEIFERSPVATLLVNADGQIDLVNRHVESLFQYSRTELVGQKIEILVPESIRGRHPELVKEYMNAPLSRKMGKGRNLFGVRKDQSQFPVEVGLNPIETNGRTFVVSSVIDITDRLRAEERFKAAVDAAPNGMLMIDSKRTIVMINKKIEEIFGYSRNELIGNSIETLVPEDFKAHHPKFVESYVKKPEPRSMGIGRELFGRHKSGKLVPVEIGLQPIFNEGEVFVISSVVDITYRRNADAEIKHKTAEIEEFSYRTSHDLRSPLKSIAGMADCVLEYLSEGNTSMAAESTGKISHLANKLMALVEDILTLTKVDASNEEMKSFDFDEFASLALEKFQASFQENNVEAQFSFHHKRDLVVQTTRLSQILDNLINNAIKYCNKENSKRFVKLQTFNNANKFFIQVEDNGSGIPNERQSEVFSMFKRFHSTAIPGSGLGLYLVKKQVQKLGAQISFESSGSGTTFYLEFATDSPHA